MDIIGKKKWYFLISLLVILPGVISLVLFGLRLSIDFTGGSLLEFRMKDKAVNTQEFEPFTQMILGLLQEAVDRLKGGRLTNLNQEAVLPLRELARVYGYSQDYLRNLINRG